MRLILDNLTSYEINNWRIFAEDKLRESHFKDPEAFWLIKQIKKEFKKRGLNYYETN